MNIRNDKWKYLQPFQDSFIHFLVNRIKTLSSQKVHSVNNKFWHKM